MQAATDEARAHRFSWSAVVIWAAFGLVLALGCADLSFRQVARHTLLPVESAGLVAVAVALLAVAGAVRAALARSPHRAGPTDRVMGLLLVAAFAGGLYTQQQLGARLQSDGFYYFAYLRSLWFDHDVEFANDYRMLGLGDKAHLFRPTPTGHAQSAWTIGPAIVWSPFFAGGDLVAHALAARAASRSPPTALRSRTGKPSASPGCSTGCSASGSPIDWRRSSSRARSRPSRPPWSRQARSCCGTSSRNRA
jgi:hypothetical protein